MKRVFLSLPMSGYTDEEIAQNITWMKEMVLDSHIFGDEEIIFLHNMDTKPSTAQLENAVTVNLLYLGAAIMSMATCDAVVFHPDWEEARGCMVECYVSYKYLIPSYYIMEDNDGSTTICRRLEKMIINRDNILFNEIEF